MINSDQHNVNCACGEKFDLELTVLGLVREEPEIFGSEEIKVKANCNKCGRRYEFRMKDVFKYIMEIIIDLMAQKFPELSFKKEPEYKVGPSHETEKDPSPKPSPEGEGPEPEGEAGEAK